MTDLLNATQPHRNANVFASAGSGKTWLLITRICRLLLSGAEPRHILAITFTRKSAAEMRERLASKLSSWATMTEKELSKELLQIGEDNDQATIQRARRLYEHIQCSPQAIRISTFHSFCEEIVRAFPLESHLPTSFEISEQTNLFANQSMQRLLAQSEKEPVLHTNLQQLYKFCFGYNGTKKALLSFLYARNEWLVYTQFSKDPAKFASQKIIDQLGNIRSEDITAPVNDEKIIAPLQRIFEVFLASDNVKHNTYAKKINDYLNSASLEAATRIQFIQEIFLTQKLEIRKPTHAKPLQKLVGESRYARHEEDYHYLANALLTFLNNKKHAAYLNVNHAWYFVGNHLLKHFQKVKSEHGIIDFSDLEWEAFRLLQKENQALWVQYKLGQRIQHFLVDEFQDTNPIQWHLLKPIIESSFEQQTESSSLFLVGDVKQSIYRFRGANPEIQGLASAWSKQNLNSDEYSNNMSWRSSPAVIECVNKIFTNELMHNQLTSFEQHICQHPDQWGKVIIHPLVDPQVKKDAIEFRNPLEDARTDIEVTAHYTEGTLIGEHISELISQKTPIYDGDKIRPAKYSDILVITRTRSHIDELKAGLRTHAIPIQSIDANPLLDYLEINDILALLTTLINELDDICLVQTLRSPIFNITNNQLIELRKIEGACWHQKLARHAKNTQHEDPLRIAHTQLVLWSSWVDRIPVHDLLNNIYSSWNILDRYQSACPIAESNQICERLTQLLHLSLETESGRYPSVARFMRALRESNPPVIQETQTDDLDAIEMMTTHGAKGLEAPIVFIADTGPIKPPPEQFKVLSSWPTSHATPTKFLLGCKESNLSEAAIALKSDIENSSSESINLLYVALTRAKQILIISGVANKRNAKNSWHSQISKALDADTEKRWTFELNQPPAHNHTKKEEITTITHSYPKNIQTPIAPQWNQEQPEGQTDSRAATYGTVVHKCLEVLSARPTIEHQALLNLIARETDITLIEVDIDAAIEEARACINHPETEIIFKSTDQNKTINEAEIYHPIDAKLSLSVIDRLIINEELIRIIDYKTDRDVHHENMQEKAKHHHAQLTRYRQAVAHLYPNTAIQCFILFTKLPALIEVS